MKTEQQIEFDKIKERWALLAVTDWAKEKILGMDVILEEGALKKQLKDSTDSRKLLELLGTPPLQDVTGIKEVLAAAEKGGCLFVEQLEQLGQALAAVSRLKGYLRKGKLYENSIAYYEESLIEMEELREEIYRTIRNGAVDDYATKELQQIRGRIAKCEEQMRQKAEQAMRAGRECMADSFCTVRNGRICVPVKKECRGKVPGSVIDASSSGNTLFIEPAGVKRHSEELQLLRINEENEVYRILYTLTAMAADSAERMAGNIMAMEKLDFLFSKGKLSIDMDAVEPSVNLERRIALKGARHPLMERDKNVPLQFEMGKGIQGIVITGPNTGGKTVAIKTVMLCCMMAQCGLHVTCEEADVCMNGAYLTDIGDGQDMAENLSTFSAHIKNVLDALSRANQESLVILDELGSGTDPLEGMGVAVAILEELRKSGALFLVTTHYPQVKEYAEQTKGIVNARMTFDRETLRPTYQMVIGEAGESCAFYIAEKLGMPKAMLQVAIRAAYGGKAAEDFAYQPDGPAAGPKEGMRISRVKKKKSSQLLGEKWKRGDSVLVYPEKKIGIVCEPANEKGVLRVQLPGRKIWINHKRVKLHVAASELYPEDYDFSIVFDTAEHRKIRHDMGRKYTKEVICQDE